MHMLHETGERKRVTGLGRLMPLGLLRRATEYAIGATLVLAHLALSGRLPMVIDAAEREARSPRRYVN